MNLRPLPHGQGSLRPTFGSSLTIGRDELRRDQATGAVTPGETVSIRRGGEARGLGVQRATERQSECHVAAAAGVTRPVVYKFFPNRHELIKGVLEDFREDYTRRVPDVEQPNDDLDVATTARAFIDAACDTIEARGSGGWQLLRSVGPDQEITAISKEFRRQLVQPWLAPLRALTGVGEDEAFALADVMVSGAGEILQRWIDGDFSREQVATLLGRIILAVLNEFTE